MRKSISDNMENKRKVAELENKVALLSQEIERLTGLLRNADVDRENYRKLKI